MKFVARAGSAGLLARGMWRKVVRFVPRGRGACACTAAELASFGIAGLVPRSISRAWPGSTPGAYGKEVIVAQAMPYRAYAPRPFLPAERDTVEILFGGLNWRAERVITAVFDNLGYRARALPPATKADLLAGRELADIGQCCPTSFTTGNLANYLQREAQRIGAGAVAERYVHLTAGACGACRFGQYHQSYELALRNLGLESFRMFLLSQSDMDQGALKGGGLVLDMRLTIGIIWAILCTDVLQGLEYRTRPYEVASGQTDAVVAASVDYLCEVFRRRPLRGRKWGVLAWHLSTGYFTAALREVFRRFEAIEVDRLQAKPVVKITGEFYLQTVEGDPNYNIHRWLESEGAEVYPAAIAVWFDYLMRVRAQQFEEYLGIDRGARGKLALVRALQLLYRFAYRRLRAALGDIPHEMPSQAELRRLAAPYFHHRLQGGEGDMLIGKALWAHLHKKAHMICELSPYGCLPNTMSIGAMAGVLGKHPDLLYAPLEIKGDAEIHALSRCQMVLSEARKRAQEEFAAALAASGLTVAAARARLDARPRLKRASCRVPRRGWIGTAANLASQLASEQRA
jgi:predicted nucleotide-binding protein (sugar kinase/HSP70/actin superfamily)